MKATRIAIAGLVVVIASLALAQSQDGRPYRKPQQLLPSRFAGEKLIVGDAKEAKPGEIPWQASVQVSIDGFVGQCGGSVIKSGWVLTAAHCVEVHPLFDLPPPQPPLVTSEQIDVRTGSVNVDHGGQESQPTAIFLMRDARDASRNTYDVALLKVTTHASATPIAMAPASKKTGDEALTPGAPLTVSGFGADNRGELSPRLLYVGVGYIRRQTCNSVQKHSGMIDATMICAGTENGNDSCGGDSGGPLFVPAQGDRKPQLVGVVSWGPRDCGSATLPGVYADLANPEIAAWIRDTLAAN